MPEYDFDLRSASDRGRLRGWVDQAPRLATRSNMQEPLSEGWRNIIVGLLDALDKALEPKAEVHQG